MACTQKKSFWIFDLGISLKMTCSMMCNIFSSKDSPSSFSYCIVQVAGSSSGCVSLRSGLGQATYTCVPLSPSSIIWYQPRGVTSLAGKVTAGLMESNGSLPPGL